MMLGDYMKVPEKMEESVKLSEEIKACQKCNLCKNRKNAVPCSGNTNASIMIIGEAPGQVEDEQGIPFVGEAGNLLDKMLLRVGIKRQEVYVTNILKCRPPGNRDPREEEIEKCSSHLRKQVDMIAPNLIIALGNFASRFILDVDYNISELRLDNIHQDVPVLVSMGKYEPISVVATYHPSYILRNPEKEDLMLKDLKKAVQFSRILQFAKEK